MRLPSCSEQALPGVERLEREAHRRDPMIPPRKHDHSAVVGQRGHPTIAAGASPPPPVAAARPLEGGLQTVTAIRSTSTVLLYET